jgi:Ca2+-transporting ATPase
MFKSAVSLAVAAIPEGLPAMAGTTLALGVEKMRSEGILIRRLDVIETLASVSVICFDKTGTLTLNRMSVAAIACGVAMRPDYLHGNADALAARASSDESLAWLLRIGVLCSETDLRYEADGRLVLDGSSTENALVQLALDAKIDAAALRRDYPRRAIRHRTEAYRYMVTIHDDAEGRSLIAVKGSPAEVLDRCAWWLEDGQQRPLTPEIRAAIEQVNTSMADEALRVLGFAFRQTEMAEPYEENGTIELTWAGLAGLADPVRPGIQELMGTLHSAGIHTLMMTGDQVPTARAVARQLGLSGNGPLDILDTAEFDHLPPDQLSAAVRRAHVLARVSPAQKLLAVRALQRGGAVVAMVGDGINDSPALKASDVGVAMGREGTEAAREVANVVLQSDDLMSLVHAIERGRATSTNIRRSIRYLLGTNLSEIAVMLAGTAAGFNEPLSVAQLLWINLVSDILPGIGLALEPSTPDLMCDPPRPADDPILPARDLGVVAREGGEIAAGALAACLWGSLRYGVSAQTRTMTFSSLVIAQLLHTLTCRDSLRDRSGGGPRSHLPPNPALSTILTLSFSAQLLASLAPGIRRLLGIVPISPLDAAVVLGTGSLPYLLNQFHRLAGPEAGERGATRNGGLRPAPHQPAVPSATG